MRTTKSALNILSFLLLFQAAPALAFLPEPQDGKPCEKIKNDQVHDFRDLLVKANISDVDTRVNGDESEFEKDEIESLAEITGTVACRSGNFITRAKGRLYQDGGTIMTSGHVFVDKTDEKIKGNSRRINEKFLPKCTFASKAKPNVLVDLKLDNPGSYKFGTMNPLGETENDFAFVKLATPIEAKWIPEFGTGPEPGETLHLVTTEAKGSTRNIDANQLVVGTCKYQDDNGTKSGFFANCSTLPGDSFGIYYAKRSGEWKAVAYHVAGGSESANGKAFDYKNPDPALRSFSLGSAFTTKFTLDGLEFQRRSSGQADAAGGRKINAVSPNKS